ncbi:hypothetical protein [Mycobacterium palustre]|uniref:Terminase n=1 Tax=Mycobacterium palustre TaxID=153971 RepID=A0A1X1ZVP2_9MYCO|nr:hypothetical protein [Mycobacterium palustre]MCV7101540.1 hypothetical protein [Mycobacterium palustre]ORW28183.1 hypothetical protein AWC19_27495 [Mycobacterium palustre]
MSKPKAPPGLGAEGRRLWRVIVADAADQGLELDARERDWLRSAAKLADRIAQLEFALADAPPRVKGSMGQLVVDPLLPELRQCVQLQAQLLGRLKLDPPAEQHSVIPTSGVNRHRQAAMRRWGGA